jgi:glycosyltransferase involved in cell wall biosynthesis
LQARSILRIGKKQAIPADPASDLPGRQQLIPRLAKQGYTSYLVTLTPRSRPVSGLPLLRNITRLEIARFDKKNPNLIWVMPPTIRTRFSILDEMVFSLTASLTIIFLWLSKKINFDVIYSSNQFFYGLVGGIVKLVTRTRWVAEPADPRPPEFYQGARGRLLRMVERIVFLLHPDIIFVNDPVNAKQLARRYGRADMIFFPVCYDNRFKQKVPAEEIWDFRSRYGLVDKIVILFAGGLSPTLNRVDILADTAAELVRKNQNIRFVIASGNEHGLRVLKEMVNNLGIAEFFVFLGRLPHEKMPLLNQACDIGININYLFNVGIKIFEAMASGKPTISAAPWYDQYDKLLINGENTLLVPLSVESLRDGILRLINDADLRRRIAENGYNSIKQFDLDYEDRFFKKLFFPDTETS